MLFYWIYGDSTIEIYLASVFFWDYDLIHRELAGSFGTGEALDQNPFAAIGPFFFNHLPIMVFFSVIKNPR